MYLLQKLQKVLSIAVIKSRSIRCTLMWIKIKNVDKLKKL